MQLAVMQTTVSLCSEGADLVLRAGSSEFVFQGFRAAYNPSLFRPPTAAAPSDGEEDDEAAAASVNLSALKVTWRNERSQLEKGIWPRLFWVVPW